MSKLLDHFNQAYNHLYDNRDNVEGYREAVKWFDDNQSSPEVQPHVIALIKERGDFISSDCEAGAFTIAYKTIIGDQK